VAAGVRAKRARAERGGATRLNAPDHNSIRGRELQPAGRR
jgi:hypothetical protein